MFCTQCHTAFSWKTGAIETRVIHNPHYFELMRQNGTLPRNPYDMNICGMDIREEIMFVEPVYQEPLRRILHIREVDMPVYRVDDLNENRDLRIDFLRQKIDEKKFKVNLQRREKLREYRKEIYNLLSLYVDSSSELIFNRDISVKNTLEQIKKLTDYVNSQFSVISKVYKMREKQIRNFKLI
jgi:hypothetical protein